jgi:hypothetical protein
VVFLAKGAIVTRGTPLDLVRQISDAQLRLTFEGERTRLLAYLASFGHGYSFPRDYELVVTAPERSIPQILYEISGLGVSITDIDVHKPDLEDVFLQIARDGNVH